MAVVGIEPSDKMTDPQIVAKVRDHYLDQRAGRSRDNPTRHGAFDPARRS